MARSALLNVMVQAAVKAGRSLVREFGEVQHLQVSHKGPRDYVNKAEHKAETIVHKDLVHARSTFSYLSKQRGLEQGSDIQHRWIVDALNGKSNFLHSLPVFSITIAMERQGKIQASVIYNPIMDELFTAERGGGAYFNDHRLRVASRRKLTDCVISNGIPHLGTGHHGDALRRLRNVMGECAGIRRFGCPSIDLAWVAAGRIDGAWETDLEPWDMASAILLLRESGGFVTDIDGSEKIFDSGNIVAGNEDIHRQLREILNKPI